jgi:hypothetical protein
MKRSERKGCDADDDEEDDATISWNEKRESKKQTCPLGRTYCLNGADPALLLVTRFLPTALPPSPFLRHSGLPRLEEAENDCDACDHDRQDDRREEKREGRSRRLFVLLLSRGGERGGAGGRAGVSTGGYFGRARGYGGGDRCGGRGARVISNDVVRTDVDRVVLEVDSRH